MEAEYLTNCILNMIAPNIEHFTNYQLNKKTKMPIPVYTDISADTGR